MCVSLCTCTHICMLTPRVRQDTGKLEGRAPPTQSPHIHATLVPRQARKVIPVNFHLTEEEPEARVGEGSSWRAHELRVDSIPDVSGNILSRDSPLQLTLLP